VIKHVEISILESSDRSPNTRNNKNRVFRFWECRRARQSRPGELHQNISPVLGVFPYGNPLLSTSKPQF